MDARGDLIDRAHAIDLREESALRVERGERRRSTGETD